MSNIDNKETIELKHTTGTASMIGTVAIVGALIGFWLQLIVAYYFGAGGDTDAYFMAASTSEMLAKLLLGGSITAVFIPTLVEKIAHRQAEEAQEMAFNLIHLVSSMLLIVLFLVGWMSDAFVSFIAPGFDQATHQLTVNLLRILLPSFGLLFLVELISGILQATQAFFFPALLRVIAPLTAIATLLVLHNEIGIAALAVGSVLGSVAQLAFVVWGLYRQGWHYRLVWRVRDPAIKKIFVLAYPFILSVLMTQVAGITYRVLVSRLEPGSLAALKFAEKLTQLLTIVFLNSVTAVIYPVLSAKAAKQDVVGMRSTIGAAIRLICFTTVPIITAVVLLREPIIALIYQRGSFSEQDAAMTSIALLLLVVGLTVNGISSVLGHATLALQETRAAVAVSIASQAIAIFLFVMLVPRFSHAGLALGSSLVPIVIAVLYWLYLSRFIPGMALVFYHVTYGKMALLALITLAIISYLRPVTQGLFPNRTLSLILEIFIPTAAGAIFYAGGAYWWKIPEMVETVGMMKNKLIRLKIFGNKL